MAVDVEEVSEIAKQYADEVREVMTIEKVILFGSYAKGTASEKSDIDICFFLPSFNGKRRTEIIYDLLRISDESYKGIYFEPIAFPISEIERGNPFVMEIISTGIEI